MAAAETISPATLDFAKMSKAQRLAAFLLILGPDGAAHILRSLEPADLEAVSLEMTRLPLLGPELQNRVLKEFSNLVLQASASICGNPQAAHATLERAVGSLRTLDILGRVAPGGAPIAAMQAVVEMDLSALAKVLKYEQPQTIALVASYMPPDRISQLVFALPEALRDPVVERLATLEPAPVEVVERLAGVLQRKLVGAKPARAPRLTGGVKTAADALNKLNKEISRGILVAVEERNPELGLAIRNRMFTFEDLVGLETASLQKILREVDLRDLALSLKNADGPLKAKLLGAISKRAAETVKEEVSFLGPVKARDLEAAKLRVIEVVRRLESEGDLDLDEARENTRHEALA